MSANLIACVPMRTLHLSVGQSPYSQGTLGSKREEETKIL